MISYSSLNEDVVLNRVFGNKKNGLFVDIGANHPVVGSVTKHFSDLGWTGINVEPDPFVLECLKLHRPSDLNVGLGISATCGKKIFYQVVENNGLSTFDSIIAENLKTIGFKVTETEIETITLVEFFDRYINDRVVDFLKIDVEGYEHEVIAGSDFARFRPRVLLIESTIPGTNTLNHEKWEPILLEAGYIFTLFDGINRYYIREEDLSLKYLLSYPANVLDGFISIKEKLVSSASEKYLRLGRPARAIANIVQNISNLVKSTTRFLTRKQ